MSYDEESIPFADNPENRCPVALVVDASASMTLLMKQLNRYIQMLLQELNNDTLARSRIDLTIITCCGSAPEIVLPMTTVMDIEVSLPTLEARGLTPMDESLNLALDIVSDHKAKVRGAGLDVYRPLIYCFTDGGFALDESTKQRLHASEANNSHKLFPFAIGDDADERTLASTTKDGFCLKLEQVDFKEFFQFVSNSLRAVGGSNPNDPLALPAPKNAQVFQY